MKAYEECGINVLMDVPLSRIYMAALAFSNGRREETFSFSGMASAFLSLKDKHPTIFRVPKSNMLNTFYHIVGELIEDNSYVDLKDPDSIALSSEQRKNLADYVSTNVEQHLNPECKGTYFRRAAQQLAHDFRNAYSSITAAPTAIDRLEARLG